MDLWSFESFNSMGNFGLFDLLSFWVLAVVRAVPPLSKESQFRGNPIANCRIFIVNLIKPPKSEKYELLFVRVALRDSRNPYPPSPCPIVFLVLDLDLLEVFCLFYVFKVFYAQPFYLLSRWVLCLVSRIFNLYGSLFLYRNSHKG